MIDLPFNKKRYGPRVERSLPIHLMELARLQECAPDLADPLSNTN